jgi:hypothetical protein
MGGIVARGVLAGALPDHVAAAIATLVTIATPHRPVARVDYAMDKYYGAIDNAWAAIWSMGL